MRPRVASRELRVGEEFAGHRIDRRRARRRPCHAVLDLSQQGRTLTINGQYTAAIANRQKVLDQLDGLTLAPQLERLRTLLRGALQASLDAAQALLQCKTCASTLAANERATDLKQQFVLEFNPLSTKFLHRSFDSDSL